jgi:transcriptional regulator with XRE-family HTH domain
MELRDPTIGHRIVETRERKGWKQKELATVAGIPVPTLNRIERGQQSLFAERVVTLAKALGVSADYLLGLIDDPTPPKKRPRSRKTAVVG